MTPARFILKGALTLVVVGLLPAPTSRLWDVDTARAEATHSRRTRATESAPKPKRPALPMKATAYRAYLAGLLDVERSRLKANLKSLEPSRAQKATALFEEDAQAISAFAETQASDGTVTRREDSAVRSLTRKLKKKSEKAFEKSDRKKDAKEKRSRKKKKKARKD